jgi:hypothetical protein
LLGQIGDIEDRYLAAVSTEQLEGSD